MKKNLAFRAWYYFRMGWGNYITFIFAAANTLTVTYYLAIEKVPSLKLVFPSFLYYVIVITAIGVPVLIGIGYFHFKKSNAFKAEADISVESNPHWKRMIENTEKLLALNFALNELILKISKNEKLTEDELKKLSSLQNELQDYIGKKTIK